MVTLTLDSETLGDFGERLLEVLETAHGACSDSVGVSLGVATLALTSPNHDSLKGFVNIHGSSIVKTDLTIRSTHHQIRLSLAPQRVYTLFQIQNVRNFLAVCIKTLKAIKEDAKNMPELIAFQVARLLHKCNELMRFMPESECYPNKIVDAKIFQPECPPDLIVEFSVKEETFITHILLLGQKASSALPTSSPAKFFTKLKQGFKTGLQKVEHENVTDIIEIKTPSPVLTLICKQIRLAIDQTQEKLQFMDMNRKSL